MNEAESGDNRRIHAGSADVKELASNADRALVTGDHSGGLAIVENIYDLLDRRVRAASPEPACDPVTHVTETGL